MRQLVQLNPSDAATAVRNRSAVRYRSARLDRESQPGLSLDVDTRGAPATAFDAAPCATVPARRSDGRTESIGRETALGTIGGTPSRHRTGRSASRSCVFF